MRQELPSAADVERHHARKAPDGATAVDWSVLCSLKDAEIIRLRRLLREARQYVADAGCEEEPGEHQAKLLADIDAILI